MYESPGRIIIYIREETGEKGVATNAIPLDCFIGPDKLYIKYILRTELGPCHGEAIQFLSLGV